MKIVGIIGAGPAGLFCAHKLLSHGIGVTMFEAGPPIEQRICPAVSCVDCKRCMVLEGDGGAGGLSDGKNTYSITRGTQLESVFDAEGHQAKFDEIDNLMVRFAGEGVWCEAIAPNLSQVSPLNFVSYPLRHVGSDGIRKFVIGMMSDLKRMGLLRIQDKASLLVEGRKAVGVGRTSGSIHDCYRVVLASGLQGIPDVEQIMRDLNVPMGRGPAGFGIRLETDAEILEPLHKWFYDYKIIYEDPETGLTLRSFCCNRKGYVINERHTDLGIVNVNGHSFLGYQTQSSNLAIIAKVQETLDTDPQAFVIRHGQGICDAAGLNSAWQPIKGFLGEPIGICDMSYMTNKQSRGVQVPGPEAASGLPVLHQGAREDSPDSLGEISDLRSGDQVLRKESESKEELGIRRHREPLRRRGMQRMDGQFRVSSTQWDNSR
jgi:uncharacterized FAD-dependent dehydrogenase